MSAFRARESANPERIAHPVAHSEIERRYINIETVFGSAELGQKAGEKRLWARKR